MMRIHTQDHSTSPVALYHNLMTHKSLIASLIRRDISERYQGSVGGLLWAFLTPILMLCVYGFVFGIVFKARFGTAGHPDASFPLAIFLGMIFFGLFAECITKSVSLIANNANFVKKIVFPLELLPFVTLGGALFHAFISCWVWVICYFFMAEIPYDTILLLPLFLIPLIAFSLGSLWLFSSLSVYLKDISQVMGLIITALMFLSAIFYPISSLPIEYQYVMYLNPFAGLIDEARSAFLFGTTPDFLLLTNITLISFIYAWIGLFFFQKLRTGFADVI